LRKHEIKKDGTTIFDMVDQVKYLKVHAKKHRKKYYDQEEFNVEEINANV